MTIQTPIKRRRKKTSLFPMGLKRREERVAMTTLAFPSFSQCFSFSLAVSEGKYRDRGGNLRRGGEVQKGEERKKRIRTTTLDFPECFFFFFSFSIRGNLITGKWGYASSRTLLDIRNGCNPWKSEKNNRENIFPFFGIPAHLHVFHFQTKVIFSTDAFFLCLACPTHSVHCWK